MGAPGRPGGADRPARGGVPVLLRLPDARVRVPARPPRVGPAVARCACAARDPAGAASRGPGGVLRLRDLPERVAPEGSRARRERRLRLPARHACLPGRPARLHAALLAVGSPTARPLRLLTSLPCSSPPGTGVGTGTGTATRAAAALMLRTP